MKPLKITATDEHNNPVELDPEALKALMPHLQAAVTSLTQLRDTRAPHERPTHTAKGGTILFHLD
jgi:hypothetical protein